MQIKRKQAAALLAAGILLLTPSKLTAEVTGKVYGNDRIPEEQISIYVETPLGLRSRVDARDCSIKNYHYGEVGVLDISYLYLRGKKRVVTVPVKSVSAEYTPSVYPGDAFSQVGLTCTTQYADGRTDTNFPLSVTNAPKRFAGARERITVATKDGLADVLIDPVDQNAAACSCF